MISPVPADIEEPLRVSVVIALHRLTPRARHCVETTAGLLGERDELIVVSDRAVDGLPPLARLVLTGSPGDTSPAEKRDAALPHVRGEICAFIDDDAYPSEDWFERALACLRDGDVVAVGGPGVTPPESPLPERVGGAYYESRLGSGALRYRFRPVGGVRDVDDFPAYNFFVRTEALRDVGGWATRFYGGEDTKLCLALVRSGHRIVYDPRVLVYHYRRPVFRPHMRQIANVGRHRGWFVRSFPETSRRAIYFAPAAAVAGALGTLIWASRSERRRWGAGGAAGGAYIAVAAGTWRDTRDARVAALLPLALVTGHSAYAVGFVRGLLTREIEAM